MVKVVRAYSVIYVLGRIWLPPVMAAMEYRPSAHDVENMKDEKGTVSREAVQLWLDCHAGDFQEVEDFSASLEVDGETVDFDWAEEESREKHLACVGG